VNEEDLPRSSGVDTLVERLRTEGVEAGRAEAQRIVADAEARAAWLVKQAEEEAAALREDARRRAERFETAARQALHVAVRDAVVRLKAELTGLFHEELGRAVSRELDREETLRALLLELVGASRDTVRAASKVAVHLPARVEDLETLRRDPGALQADPLTDLVRSFALEMLAEGVTLHADPTLRRGFRLRLGDAGVELDFSEETVVALLEAHLQPRFRALVEGLVR
jgi:V/A-type H+-transporting ATPase subunit E